MIGCTASMGYHWNPFYQVTIEQKGLRLGAYFSRASSVCWRFLMLGNRTPVVRFHLFFQSYKTLIHWCQPCAFVLNIDESDPPIIWIIRLLYAAPSIHRLMNDIGPVTDNLGALAWSRHRLITVHFLSLSQVIDRSFKFRCLFKLKSICFLISL